MPDDKQLPSDGSADNSDKSKPTDQLTYITADQFNQTINQLTQTFQSGLAAIAQARNSDPMTQNLPTPIALPSDNEIIEEIQSGGVSKLKQLIKGAVDKVRDEEVRPFQEQGTRVLADQAKNIAIMSGAMPHYNRFKKDIDELVNRLPANQRTTVEVYQGIHDLVVGKNFNTYSKEIQQAAILAARESSDASLPGSTGGRQPNKQSDPNAIPTFESIYGADGTKLLAQLGKGGRTPDGFAQNLGYKDWPTYYTEVLKPEGVTANV